MGLDTSQDTVGGHERQLGVRAGFRVRDDMSGDSTKVGNDPVAGTVLDRFAEGFSHHGAHEGTSGTVLRRRLQVGIAYGWVTDPSGNRLGGIGSESGLNGLYGFHRNSSFQF
tara:strand:- start:73 stop:408 length:336 start_codon:yes stop_codon:yes gene_type:complete